MVVVGSRWFSGPSARGSLDYVGVVPPGTRTVPAGGVQPNNQVITFFFLNSIFPSFFFSPIKQSYNKWKLSLGVL